MPYTSSIDHRSIQTFSTIDNCRHAALFGGLKDQHCAAVKMRVSARYCAPPSQHSGMPVVAQAVHLAPLFLTHIQARRLL